MIFKVLKLAKGAVSLLSSKKKKQSPIFPQQKVIVTNPTPTLKMDMVKDELQPLMQKSQDLLNDSKTMMEKTAQKAITDAAYNVPPALNGNPSHAEKTIIAQHDKVAAEISHLHLDTRRKEEKKKAELEEKLNNPKTIEYYSEETEKGKRKDLAKAAKNIKLPAKNLNLFFLILKEGNVLGVSAALKEQVRHLKEKLSHSEVQYQNLMNEYNQIPPMKGWLNYGWVFWGLVTFLFFLEISVNFTSFQTASIGESNTGAMLLGVFFAVGLALTAKELGVSLYKKNKTAIKIFAAATFLLCILLSAFRLNMEVPVMTKIFYFIINFIIAGGTVILAFFHANNKEFFNIQALRYKFSAKIDAKENYINIIESDYQEKCEAIEWESKHQSEKMMEQEKEELKTQLEQCAITLAKVNDHEKECLGQLAATKQNALDKYQDLLQNTLKSKAFLEKDNKDKPKNGIFTPLKNASILLLMASLSCFGCTPNATEELAETHLEILYDQTGITTSPEIDPILNYVLSTIDIDTKKGEWGKITVSLSQIGEVSTQSAQVLTLPPSQSFFTRNEMEHRKLPQKFTVELKQALTELTVPSKGKSHSYIHRNMYHRLNHLSKMEGKRIVLVWSDLIVNEPKMSHYRFKKNPEQILLHKDSLITLMTDGYSLPSLKGVTLVNIYQPTKIDDELHEVCKRYFRYYFENLGMKVIYKTNLPASMDLVEHHPNIEGVSHL